jgi:hypothetical protein
MERKDVEELLNQKVEAMRQSMVPHNCFTCGWFIMRTEKPHNKACRYPNDLVTKGNRCLCWKFEVDPEKRGQGLC